MSTSTYYRIYNVVGGNMSKQRLVLPNPWATSKKKMLGADHKLPDKDEAIAILEKMMEMQRRNLDLGSVLYKGQFRALRIRRQLALAELGYGSGRLVAISNEKDEVVRL